MTKQLTMTAVFIAFLFNNSLALAWSGHQVGTSLCKSERNCGQ